MSPDQPPSPASMADLLESAVALSDLGPASGRAGDPEQYRHPLGRLSNRLGDRDRSGAIGEIDWSPALRAAYRDGYDPLLWIGRGASSDVWRCVDRSFGREVALKVPCLDPGRDVADAVDGLQAEAELLGKLHHPGVVHAVRRAGEGRSAYLALDFVDGEDLFEHCRLMQLGRRARLRLFEKVLATAAYLHGKGVVHGDLKPEHLLVREDDQPVLIDFGLSSYDTAAGLRLHDSGRLGGSGIYRAPEIANATATSSEPQHDVYALGVLLRELLREAPGERAPDGVDDVVARATQTQADARWPDAGAMLEALRAAMQSETPSIDSPQQSAGQASRGGLQRGSLFFVALGLAVAAVIGVIYLFPGDPVVDLMQRGEGGERQPLAVQASVFDVALADIYAGDIDRAEARVGRLVDAEGTDQQTGWEVAHLRAMLDGTGEQFPLGPDPYDAPHAFCLDYDPASETVAYVKRAVGTNEVWVRAFDAPPRLIFDTISMLRAVAISPGAERLATIGENGRVTVRVLAGEQTGNAVDLPRQADDRVIWFGPDGTSLFTFSPQAKTLACWALDAPLSDGPAWSIDRCDHALPLASGEGCFLVATAGEHRENRKTLLRLFGPNGEIRRQLEMRDAQVPVSADTRPGDRAVVCLGMPNGYVRIHDSARGGWQTPCDLGINSSIPAVVYSEEQGRAFAGLGRVHVVDRAGQLKMRLGDRNDHQQLITELHFHRDTASLTCLSIQKVWRCEVE